MGEIIKIEVAQAGEQPDLGWLLHSNQVDDEALCAILIDDYLAELEDVAFLLTGSPVEMIHLVNQTLIQVIAHRADYNGEVGGRAWLWSWVVKESVRQYAHQGWLLSRGVSREMTLPDLEGIFTGHAASIYRDLGSYASLLFLCQDGYRFSVEEIAYLVGKPLGQTQADIRKTYEQVARHQESCPQCYGLSDATLPAASALLAGLQANRPEMDYRPVALARWQTSILDEVRHGHAVRMARARRLQLFEVTCLVALLFTGAWLVARLPRQPASPLVLSSLARVGVTPSVAPRPVPATTPSNLPVANLLPAQPPVPTVSTILGLAQANLSQWHSLWADVEVKHYDPSGLPSNENSQIVRKQMWIEQPSSVRVIAGPLNGEPDQTTALAGDQITLQDFLDGQSSSYDTHALLDDPDLQKLIMPQTMLVSGGQYEFEGSDTIAGRPAWIIDHHNGTSLTEILGIDQRYGLILFRREYGGKDQKTILSETQVTAIAYNPPIPSSIFNLTLYLGDQYAANFSGVPDIHNTQNALAAWKGAVPTAQRSQVITEPALHPSTSQLAFRYPPGSDPGPTMDVFASGHYLGSIPLGGNSILTCERSPDGRMIAYNSNGQGITGDTSLYLADLSSLQSAYRVMPDGFTLGGFAFAPDSQRLAFFGCDKSLGTCGVFILNLLTRQTTRLISLLYADYLLWKPDGQSLALVGARDTQSLLDQKRGQNLMINEITALSQPWQFYVLNASNGNIQYEQSFQWSLLSAPPGSPTLNWPVSLKSRDWGVEDCVNPPAQP